MSAQGAAVMALAGEIVEALLADEKDGGYDLTAGLFGPAFSTLVRRWARAETGVYFMGASLVNGQFTGVLQRRDLDGTTTVVDSVQTSEATLREGGCFAQLREQK